MDNNVILIAMQKNGTLVLFSEKPQRSKNGNWCGKLYVNSIFYNKLNNELKMSDMNNSWDVQPVICDFFDEKMTQKEYNTRKSLESVQKMQMFKNIEH